MSDLRGARVLVVEDDAESALVVSEALEFVGCSVARAANGLLALDLLSQSPASFQVVLLDLMMPVMNGWEFREVQRRQPDLASIPVVVVSAAGPRTEIPAIPADAWLSKPVDFDALLDTIRPFCRRRAES